MSFLRLNLKFHDKLRLGHRPKMPWRASAQNALAGIVPKCPGGHRSKMPWRALSQNGLAEKCSAYHTRAMHGGQLVTII